MRRLLVPAALAVLAAGCARPGFFGPRSGETVAADPAPAAAAGAPTVVVREIHYEPPVVYVDTVYCAVEPEPAETVCYVEEYVSYVYVDEPEPPAGRSHPRREMRPPPGRREQPERRGDEPSRPPEERPRRPAPQPEPEPEPPLPDPGPRTEPVPKPAPERQSEPVNRPVSDAAREAPGRPQPPSRSAPPEKSDDAAAPTPADPGLEPVPAPVPASDLDRAGD